MPTHSPNDPFIGRTIANKFVVEERLGTGGMGAVYRAKHVDTQGDVAVKLLAKDMVDDETHVRRFLIEATNTHLLRHPNTVTVSDYGETDDNVLYIVMEFVEGMSLKQALLDGAISPRRAVRIARQILKSLGEAHAKRVVHRDIKPHNIMLLNQFGEQDFVKVLDFGISRSLDGSGAHTVGAIGTPAFMAPEQWESKPVDGRADLYAIGCLLYNMLAGQPPFVSHAAGAEKLLALMYAHVRMECPPLNNFTEDRCPAPLHDLVMSLLHKSPDDRPPDAETVLQRLTEIRDSGILSDEPLVSRPAQGATSSETVSIPGPVADTIMLPNADPLTTMMNPAGGALEISPSGVIEVRDGVANQTMVNFNKPPDDKVPASDTHTGLNLNGPQLPPATGTPAVQPKPYRLKVFVAAAVLVVLAFSVKELLDKPSANPTAAQPTVATADSTEEKADPVIKPAKDSSPAVSPPKPPVTAPVTSQPNRREEKPVAKPAKVVAKKATIIRLTSNPTGARVFWVADNDLTVLSDQVTPFEWTLPPRAEVSWKKGELALRFEREGHIPHTVELPSDASELNVTLVASNPPAKVTSKVTGSKRKAKRKTPRRTRNRKSKRRKAVLF